MSTIVGKGSSYLRCDTPGCNRETAAVSGPNDGQSNVDEFARAAGWRVGWQDKHVTCPTCLAAERARIQGEAMPHGKVAMAVAQAVSYWLRSNCDGTVDYRCLPHHPNFVEEIRKAIQFNS